MVLLRLTDEAGSDAIQETRGDKYAVTINTWPGSGSLVFLGPRDQVYRALDMMRVSCKTAKERLEAEGAN